MSLRFLLVLVVLVFPLRVFADPVWIYVPSEKEKNSRHIDGDIRLTVSDVVSGVAARYPEKDTEIRLYCRSGSRASIAASALVEAGYTNVQNIGAVNDAKDQRGL